MPGPTPKLTPDLRDEYESLFARCQINAERRAAVDRAVQGVLENRSRYRDVADGLGIPWYFLAAIHNLESSRSFKRHLHNGDPLSARTVRTPPGRPEAGAPPFTWEDSARDALTLKRLNGIEDWGLASTLYRLEAYNGWGYRRHHPDVLSPYVWSFTNHYVRGKYVADGTWGPKTVSDQCGGAALLRRLAEIQEITFPPPEPVRYATKRPADERERRRATTLQEWLNGHPGIFVRVDGIPGQRTSEAYKSLTGAFLPGDPRGA